MNVQREKKKRSKRRGGKKPIPRGNNPLAYGNASSTFDIPTHRMQTNAPLLLPARALDDYRAGGGNLLEYAPRPPMPLLAAQRDNAPLLERMDRMQRTLGAGASAVEDLHSRLQTLSRQVGQSNLMEMRPIPKPVAPNIPLPPRSRTTQTVEDAAAPAAPRGVPVGTRRSSRPRRAPDRLGEWVPA